MNENSQQNALPSQSRNPYTLWFVVLAFVAPVLLAYYVFYFVNISTFNNHGELLKPMIHVSALQLKDTNHVLVATNELTYKWRFISFVNSSCDSACTTRLIESRQIHKTLGKDQHRVLLVVVELAEPDKALADFISAELPDAIVLKADAAVISNVLPPDTELYANDIYIQDPMGNIMMRFSQDQPAEDFRYDIRKLLKASQIG